MTHLVATLFVRTLECYAMIGALFALYFGFVGCERLDPMARKGSLGFRLLIMPASAALWPLLLTRLLKGQNQPPLEKSAHRRAAGQR